MIDGLSYKYEFKMFMEGIVVPFQSAVISCTPNGVEMNIVLHPTTTLFDLKPKTFIQIFYKDWFGPVEKRGWHLLGEGYFSGFSKSDTAEGMRSISIVCRDFRMDIRKTPSAFIYSPDTQEIFDPMLKNVAAFGLKRWFTITLPSIEEKKEGPAPAHRTWGGVLNNFYAMLNTIAGTATGKPSASFPNTNDGRFLLDAIVRGLWIESVCGTGYGSFINTRIRADKRIFVPENRAGYTFFNQQYLDSFGSQTIMANSAFSSVESIMMRIAAIFQAFPVSCSTPTLIDADDAMCKPVFDFMVNKNFSYFGAPFIMNQSMILPPLNLTAPPNCNIFFPCLYNSITWMHDYDVDNTRVLFKEMQCFGDSTGKSAFDRYITVPNSLLTVVPNSEARPPLTIEERYRGVMMGFGSLEYLVAAKNTTYASAEAIIGDPEKLKRFNQILKKLQIKEMGKISKLYENLAADNSELDYHTIEAERHRAIRDIESALLNQDVSKDPEMKNIISEVRPNVDDVLRRHAVIKFIMERFNSRTITVNSDFNPYPVCGFPAAVLADDNRKGAKTLKTLVGMIQVIRHTISANGFASSSFLISTVRYIDEPTDIDMFGTPLFVKSTNPKDAEIDPKTFKYKRGYSGQVGQTKANYKYSFGKYYDIEEGERDPEVKWAKDLLSGPMPATSPKSGKKESTSGFESFLDSDYHPNRVMLFYSRIFNQDPLSHFMVGIDTSEGNERYYIYDSIHEALESLEKGRRMTDYESAMAFVRRDVITEEQYFFGILGASYKSTNENSEIIYKTKGLNPNPKEARKEFDNLADRKEYFGITTDNFNKLDKQRKEAYGSPGAFSSIMEKYPLTPFIKERREIAEQYAMEVSKYVYAIR